MTLPADHPSARFPEDPHPEVVRLRMEAEILAGVIEDLGELADQLAAALRRWVYDTGRESDSMAALARWEVMRG